MATKNRFTSDYKKEIVKLVTELGKKPSEVAEDIGVTATTVRRWVKQVPRYLVWVSKCQQKNSI